MPLCHYFRFKLRTLLIVVAIVAIGPLGCVAYCKNWIRERNVALWGSGGGVHPIPLKGLNCAPPWPLGMFGEVGWPQVVLDERRAGDLDQIQSLFPEALIYVWKYEPPEVSTDLELYVNGYRTDER